MQNINARPVHLSKDDQFRTVDSSKAHANFIISSALVPGLAILVVGLPFCYQWDFERNPPPPLVAGSCETRGFFR